jgi:hypothetical protein
MDWDRVRSKPARSDPPAPEVLEVCWRVRTPNNKVVTCGIFRDAAPGVEVRASFSHDDLLLRSERAPEIGTARNIAAAWKAAVIAKGFVEMVDEGHG